MPSMIAIITLVLFLFIIKVQSSYYVYTYEEDASDEEHCCLVRIGEKFCLARPLTRSLIQVNKQCQGLEANDNKKNYLNKILRRLNTQTTNKTNDRILIQLEKALDKNILNHDLLCLSATTNNIDLEKCYVRVVVDQKKKPKQKNQNETTDEEESTTENSIQQIELTEPVQIRKGHGLSVRQKYELNVTDFHAATRQQRECWSWYRKHTKDILTHPTKSPKTCISLNNQEEKCLKQLFYKQSDGESYSKSSIQIGSKLYCETQNQQTKLLGYHRRSELCFLTHYQIFIDHQFTDFVSLSDRKKNLGVLQFISNDTKLTNEFEADCDDEQTLVDIKKSLVEEAEAEANTVEENSSTAE